MVFILGMLVSCSPRLSHTMLNFFFDGVPPPEKVNSQQSNDMVSMSALKQSGSVERGGSYKNKYFLHQPYEAKFCTACHKENNLAEMIAPEEKLCNHCHDSYDGSYQVIHGPVDAGMCLTCHDPHMSAYPGMLKNESSGLCSICHVKDQLSETVHGPEMDINCIDCHDPHAGDLNLLRYNSDR